MFNFPIAMLPTGWTYLDGMRTPIIVNMIGGERKAFLSYPDYHRFIHDKFGKTRNTPPELLPEFKQALENLKSSQQNND